MVTVIFALLKEIVFGMVGKIAFKHVGERFATRLVIHGLKKLKEKSTNDVVDGTVDDIIQSLKGKKLKIADDHEG
jgi:hypothetical protein